MKLFVLQFVFILLGVQHLQLILLNNFVQNKFCYIQINILSKKNFWIVTFCLFELVFEFFFIFRKFLEAFRHIFQEKESLSTSDNHLVLSRQGTQIQTILTAIRHLTNNSKDEFKDEVWARCLLFLLNINDQLITIGSCKSQGFFSLLRLSKN